MLEQYSDIIQDTTHDLNVQLQRIDEKMSSLTAEKPRSLDAGINLKDERAVTGQCLHICQEAKTYLESLVSKEKILQAPNDLGPGKDAPDQFEAQNLTRESIDNYRDGFAETIGRLKERLDAMLSAEAPNNEQRAQLQKDILASQQCLEVCKEASNEVSRRRIYQVGEAVSDGDSDQVLVTTIADLFDVKKALSLGRSAQLLGMMKDDTLQKLSSDRYGSRFGTMASGQKSEDDSRSNLPTSTPTVQSQVEKGRQESDSALNQRRWNANDAKKRTG